MNTSPHTALDSTRKMANEAMERASERMTAVRSGVNDLASRGMSTVSQRASATRVYVGEHPMKSALIAAAVGAAVAGLIIALRRHHSDTDF